MEYSSSQGMHDEMAYCALICSPVSKAFTVPFVDIDSLVAVPGSPGIMVYVTHHLCLNLQQDIQMIVQCGLAYFMQSLLLSAAKHT